MTSVPSSTASTTAASTESHMGFVKDEEELTNYDYILVYGLLGLFQSIAFVAGILMVNERTLSASMNLHQSIFHRVLHSTIDFIWTTPVGQVDFTNFLLAKHDYGIARKILV